jgi:hypothetical protein
MCYPDLGTAEALMNLNMSQARRRAERAHLASIAGTMRRQRLSGQGFRLVNQLGHTLAALGQRMEQVGLPQSSPQ